VVPRTNTCVACGISGLGMIVPREPPYQLSRLLSLSASPPLFASRPPPLRTHSHSSRSLSLSINIIMASLRHVLEASVVGASATPILSVPSTDSVTEVFSTLVRNNILSAPVYNASTQTFVGIIDILDLLMLFTEVFSRTELQALSSLEAIASNQMRFTKEQFNRTYQERVVVVVVVAVVIFVVVVVVMAALPHERERVAHHVDLSPAGYFANHTRFVQAAQINDMAGLSGVNPFVPVQEGENLWNIVGLMVERHLHRVPVLRSEHELVNYITQSSVMQVVHDNIHLLDESIRTKTVGVRVPYLVSPTD